MSATNPADVVAVLRDLMLDRAERGLPVAWIAEVGQPKGRPVHHPLHVWVAEQLPVPSPRLGRLWVIRRTTSLDAKPITVRHRTLVSYLTHAVTLIEPVTLPPFEGYEGRRQAPTLSEDVDAAYEDLMDEARGNLAGPP